MRAGLPSPPGGIYLACCCVIVFMMSVSPVQSWWFSRWFRPLAEGGCESSLELSQYEPCPMQACLSGGVAENSCCINKEFRGFFFPHKSCHCDPEVQCLRDQFDQRPVGWWGRSPYDEPPRPGGWGGVPSGEQQPGGWWEHVPARDQRPIGSWRPAPPPELTKRPPAGPDDSFEGYCSLPVEFNFYKKCDMDLCENAENQNLCCKRQSNNGVICVCHPRLVCDDSETEPEREDDGSGESRENVTTSQPVQTAAERPSDDEASPRSLCDDQNRLLHGTRVRQPCRYLGIARLSRRVGEKNQFVCNAVYTVASVRGTVKRTFLTANACMNLTDVYLGDYNELKLEIQIGSQTYPVMEPIFSTAQGPNGNGFIDINPEYVNLFTNLGECQSEACPYNPDAMRGRVDLNNCSAVSWGASQAATFAEDGLQERTVAFYPGGCLDQEDLFGAKNTLCFRTIDGKNAYCSGDAGAPVYCRATASKEWILVGTLASQTTCDGSPYLKVIPFPL